MLVSNHPQLAGGSHLPDITVITPVFDRGKVRAWAGAGHAVQPAAQLGCQPWACCLDVHLSQPQPCQSQLLGALADRVLHSLTRAPR